MRSQPDSRLLLHKLLEPLGFDLREAVNGQEAVAMSTQWRPHLIFMDMRMPIMALAQRKCENLSQERLGVDEKSCPAGL